MNILITGATGFIGRHLVHTLQKSDHNISICVRKIKTAKTIKVFTCDFSQMVKITDWLPVLMHIDVVINCVGIIAETNRNSFQSVHHLAPKALFNACEKTKVKRIIHISALGADESARVAYHKSKKLADDVLQNSSLEWFILRPSLIYGKGGKSFAFFKHLSQWPIIPLVGSGLQRIQPVNIKTLIAVIEKCLISKHSQKIINVVSKKPITYKQWMLQLRTFKFKPWFLPLPLTFITVVLTLLQPLGFKLLSKDNILMLEQNNTADSAPMLDFMEYKQSLTGE